MKEIICIVSILLLLSFCGCKKKSTSTDTTTGTNPPDGLYGALTSFHSVRYTIFGIDRDSSVEAKFYSSVNNFGSWVSAGTVTVNGDTLLKYNGNMPSYYTGLIHPNVDHMNWNISGSGTTPAMSFSYSPIYPVISTVNFLADTIKQANGLSFQLNISNLGQEVYLYIQDGISTSITKTLSSFPATITLSPSELSSFVSGSRFNVNFTAVNTATVVLIPENIRFMQTNHISKVLT